MRIKKLVITLLGFGLFCGPIHAKNDKAHDHSLPPGLYKKHEKGKPLPPGWQKKLNRGDILDESIYARGIIVVPLGEDGYISIEVEGTTIKLNEKTREIIDILH